MILDGTLAIDLSPLPLSVLVAFQWALPSPGPYFWSDKSHGQQLRAAYFFAVERWERIALGLVVRPDPHPKPPVPRKRVYEPRHGSLKPRRGFALLAPSQQVQ